MLTKAFSGLTTYTIEMEDKPFPIGFSYLIDYNYKIIIIIILKN